jgi:hypothetical protein
LDFAEMVVLIQTQLAELQNLVVQVAIAVDWTRFVKGLVGRQLGAVVN